MPKYIFEEEELSDWLPYHEENPNSSDVEAKPAEYRREADGQLSIYEPAQSPLNPKNLQATAQLALSELMQLGVTQMVVRYDGGHDEGFAHLQEARTQTGLIPAEELVAQLQNGPLGEVPQTPFFYRPPGQVKGVTRKEWTQESLDLLVFELASQLLGGSYGTGAYSLEGTLIADFRNNTSTDIPPLEIN